MITLALALLAAEQLVPELAKERPPATVTLSAGTQIHFATVTPLDSRSARQGQRFELRVLEDVQVGSIVVIRRGASAIGEIEAVAAKGMVGKPGRLLLSPLFIDVAGERVNLVGTSEVSGKDSTTGVAVGTLLLSGLGMFISGKSASVAPGSSVSGTVRTDATLQISQGTAAAVHQ